MCPVSPIFTVHFSKRVIFQQTVYSKNKLSLGPTFLLTYFSLLFSHTIKSWRAHLHFLAPHSLPSWASTLANTPPCPPARLHLLKVYSQTPGSLQVLSSLDLGNIHTLLKLFSPPPNTKLSWFPPTSMAPPSQAHLLADL